MKQLDESKLGKPQLSGVLRGYAAQIKELQEKGYSKRKIFFYFTDQKIISCTYKHFNATVNKLFSVSLPDKEPIKPKEQPSSKKTVSMGSFTMERLGKDEFK